MTDTHIPQPGDIGFARTTGIMAKMILLGTWLKFRKAEHNHEFVVDRVVDGVPYVIQARIKGVTDTDRLDEVAPGGSYVLVTPPPEVDIEKFLSFCRKQVGKEYGILTDVAMGVDIITWNWVPAFRGARTDSWQCAALINEGLRFGGWYHDWVDIYNIFPDEGRNALISVGAKAFVYRANVSTEVVSVAAPIVDAHAQSRVLHETVYTPTHPQRGDSSAEFKASKKALEKETPGCWICGDTTAVLEGHHLNTEWSLINSVDLAKIRETFPAAKSLEQWLDSVDNGTILCAKCHRSSLYGVHMITFPAWVVQKYQLDGWDLVNGPATGAAMALYDDPTLYYPEH